MRRCASAASAASSSATRRERLWQWRHGPVHYETAGDAGAPLLLLPGFGVGTFHFGAQLEALSASHRVYALDFLGQGQSWPDDASGLQFSAEQWAQQAADFVEEVIGEPAYLAGNSLGGFVSAYVGATRPELVRGVVLLNATPFWGSVPNPAVDPAGAARFPWDGRLPAPWLFTALVGLWWDTLRNPSTIRALLGLVYTDKSALDDALVDAIVAPTCQPQAKEVFVSIFLSPRLPLAFNEMLNALRCPVWCVPPKADCVAARAVDAAPPASRV